MEDGVWDALWSLDPEDTLESFRILFLLLEQGPGTTGALWTDISLRKEWHAGYQVMLPSEQVMLTFAPMEREGRAYYEVAYPTLLEWPE
jgi:hypothetical protein